MDSAKTRAVCISYRTVEHHRASLTAKLNVRRTAALVKYAIARGYLQPG